MREITYDLNGKEEFMYNNYREVQFENGRNILDVSVLASCQISCQMHFNVSTQWMLFINFAVFMYLKI